MNEAEAIAEMIVKAILPGAGMEYSEVQHKGECDFNLVLAHGESVPLEVTVSTQQAYRALSAAIRGNSKDGQFVQGKLCSHGWYVFPALDADIKRIRRDIDKYLADLEAEGLERFIAYTDAADSKAVSAILCDLRVEAGAVLKWKRDRLIGLSDPSRETVLDAKYVNRAIEREASKPDNRRKLSKQDAAERHLFVYIEHEDFCAWYAINGSELPEEKPQLPNEITDVWAAARSRTPDTYVVWRGTSQRGWIFSATVTLSTGRVISRMDRPA